MDEFVFPEWMILVIFLVLFFGAAALFVHLLGRGREKMYAPFVAERERAAALAGSGYEVEASVRAWESGGGSDRNGVDGFHLTVGFELYGRDHEVRFPVWIDDRLAVGFAPGSTVPLLVDRTDPRLVAIDRRKATVEIPR